MIVDTSALLAIARETIASGKLRDDWSVGFMTERYYRKVVEMERAGQLR